MRKRNIFIIAAIVVLIPVIGFAWWLLSPLFLTTTVDEEFPFAANAEIPANMTMAEVEVVLETMAKMDQEPMAEPMPLPLRSDMAGHSRQRRYLRKPLLKCRKLSKRLMAGDNSAAMEKMLEEMANAGPRRRTDSPGYPETSATPIPSTKAAAPPRFTACPTVRQSA